MRKVYGFAAAAKGLLEIIPDQAAVVQEIYRQYLSGKSLGGIADFLFENHVPSPTSKEKWSVSVLDSMLTNNKYIGSIISFEDYFAVQVEKGKRSSIDEDTNKRKATQYYSKDVLSGLLLASARKTTGYARGSKKAMPMSKRKKSPRLVEWMQVCRPHQSAKGGRPRMDNKSLAHTKWNCKYHVVFAPKYRRQAIYGKLKSDIGSILRRLCEYKGIEIIEANACPDHIHMLVSIPPKYSVSSIIGYLKGKSSLMIFDRHANLKYKYGNRQFWCTGYYVDTVGRNKKAIREYIRNQLQEDIVSDQISLKEYTDPFTGEQAKQGK